MGILALPAREVGADRGILREFLFHHRVAEVGDPRQSRRPGNFEADIVRRDDRIRRPDGRRRVLCDQSHGGTNAGPLPRPPPVRMSKERRMPPEHRQMALCVERKRAANGYRRGNVPNEVRCLLFVCARIGGQDHRVPAELGQVANEPQRALHRAASRERWKLKDDHQYPPPPHRASAGSHRSRRRTTWSGGRLGVRRVAGGAGDCASRAGAGIARQSRQSSITIAAR